MKKPSWINPSIAVWPWLQIMLRERLEKRFNVVILICGMAGVGKSYSSMSLCKEMDPSFNVDRVCFSHTDIFSQVDKLEKKNWLVIDEPALSGIASKRTWINEAQQALVDLIESFRFKNLGVCFNTISSQLLDKTIRELLCHYLILIMDRGYGKVYAIEPSQFDSKVRTPYLGDAYFELPPQDLIEAYETKRAAFIKSRYFKSLNEVTAKESSASTFRDILEAAKNHLEELRNKDGRIDTAMIQDVLGVGKDRSYHIKRRLEELYPQ